MRLVLIGFLACAGLASCETVQGAGRDIQNAGQAMENAME